MVFRDLSPLVKTPSEIAYAKHSDIKSIIQKNPYEKPEEELIEEFNSSTSTPQLVFLGLDESTRNGLQYNNYVGAPQFAVDVTPKGSYEEEANSLIAELERRGLSFAEGMRAMNFPAGIGVCKETVPLLFETDSESGNIRYGQSSSGLERPQSVLRNMRPAYAFCPCRRKAGVSVKGLSISGWLIWQHHFGGPHLIA